MTVPAWRRSANAESYELTLQLQETLESRAAIEQAEGIIMAAQRCGPAEAFAIRRRGLAEAEPQAARHRRRDRRAVQLGAGAPRSADRAGARGEWGKMPPVRLSGTGVWAWQLRMGDEVRIAEDAAELEALGYTAVWIPDVTGDVLSAVELLLKATRSAVAATGILNVWLNDPDDVAARRATWSRDWRERALLGLGISHGALIDRLDAAAGRWDRPVSRMREYLDRLDAAPAPLERDRRVLAALGPRMLELARDRAAGAHPYLVTPEHTARARAALGPGRLLAPEQAVVLETDPAAARAVARAHVSGYLALPNYANNLRRLGFEEDDLTGGGSDRLVDAIVAHGDVETLAERVRAHRDAGADHVCIQVLTAGNATPRREWREIAPAVTG